MKFKSQVFTQASGSVGGLTYSHNAGGMYTRARAIPSNPNSLAQQDARAAMASLVVHWGDVLTATERAAWSTYAANTPVTDRLGDPINLSGQQMFLRCNLGRIRASRPVVETAPTVFNLGNPIDSIDLVERNGAGDGTDITMSWNGLTSDDGDVYVQLGLPQGAGINFYKAPFRFIQSEAAGVSIGTLTSSIADTSYPFGPVAVGTRLPIRIVCAYDDGRYTAPFTGIYTVLANTP